MRLLSTGASFAALVAAASLTSTLLAQTPPPQQQGQQTGRGQGQGQAQGRAGGQARGQGQGQAGGARQPARDNTDQAAPKDGTGVITGAVVGSDTGRAVRRVRVNLAGGDLRSSRSAVTDDAGRFSFAALPPGRYTLNASKPGYVNVMYGQKRPGRPGTPIQLADGQQLTDLKMVLPKGGVLTGVVLDENGDPTPGTQVSAWRWEMRTGEKRLTQAGSDQTDDRGQYRIYGLLPGDYVVRATPRNALGDLRQVVQDVAQSVLGGRGGAGAADALGALGQMMGGGRGGQAGRGAGPGGGAGLGNLQQLMGGRGGQGGQAMDLLQGLMNNTGGADDNGVAYAPVYYPGTTTSTAAATVTLGVSEERQSLDFQLQLVQTATVSGLVTSADGDLGGVQLTLVNETEQAIGGGVNMTRVQQDGTFSFANIAPGQYVLKARARRGGPTGGRGGRGGGAPADASSAPAAPPEVLWGDVSVAVNGQAVTGVSVTLQPGMKVAGHLVFDGGAMPTDLTRVRVALSPAGGGGGLDLAQNAPAQVDASGRFTITGVSPGRYTLRVQGQVQSFTLRSAVSGGRDMLDFPLDVKPNEDVADIAVTMTTQTQELSGSLSDNTGNPATDYTVIVFPAEQQYWTPQSRRIVSARPGTDGKFFARNLPPGDYMIAAVTDVEPGEWFDPAFLTQLRAAAARVTLNAGDKRTQDLKISGGGTTAGAASPSR